MSRSADSVPSFPATLDDSGGSTSVPAPASRRSRGWEAWGEAAGVFGFYLLLTVLFTYPAALQFQSHFIGDGGDGFQGAWNLWWIKTALVERHIHPYFTDQLFYPNGVSLLFQSFQPFTGLVSIPFQQLFGLTVAYNAVVFFSFAASGTGMYYLAHHLAGRRAAALVAGGIFAFCPFHFAHALGHLHMVSTEWIPIFVLFLLLSHAEPGMRNPIFAGLALVLNALCSWYFAFYCLIFTAMFLLARFLEDGRALLTSAFAKRIGVIALVSFVVIAPLLLPMIHAKLSNTYLVEHDSIIWSADLQSFFIPNGVLTWGRLWFLDWIETWTGNSAENANYIGYGLLALSIYGWARIPKSRFWGAAGLGFAILALGPYLHVGGQVHEGFPLPYRFLERYTPLVGFMGVPERMTLMLYTCLAVVAALSLTRIAESAGGGRRGTIVILTIGALLMVEYRTTPFPTVRLDIPHFYRELAQEPKRFGVIDVPRDSRALYFSTIHGKPLVGGYVSRRAQSDRDFLEQTPIIATLTVGAPAPPEARRLAREVFTEHDIRYVISRGGSHVGFLEETLALPLHFEGDGIRVYRTLRGPVGVDTPREAGGEISDRARIR